jgi:hypothetical protein
MDKNKAANKIKDKMTRDFEKSPYFSYQTPIPLHKAAFLY